MTREEDDVYKDFAKENKIIINKNLAKGSFCNVKEITLNNKVYANKIN